MSGRRSISAALLTALAAAAPTAHAAPPARISHLAPVSSLSERDREDIRAYSDYWAERLASSDPQEVDDANARLIDPLRAPRVSQVFRIQYAKSAVPRIQKIVEQNKFHPAVNALQVAGYLATPDALKVIVDRASIDAEPDWGVRLSAAKYFALAVAQDTIPQNEINPGLRQLGAAAGREEHWLVLRRQFEALAAVHSTVSRDVQIEVLHAIVDRINKQDGPSDLMQAVYPAIKLLFDEYTMHLRDPAEKQAFGTTLAPILGNVCAVANKHWDGAQSDEEARDNYGGAVHISEQLLRLIDGQTRSRQAGPRTRLGPAWQERDRGLFRDDHEKWRAVLNGPPYRKP